MKSMFALSCVGVFAFAGWPQVNAQSMMPDVYFSSGWCPRPDEVAMISKHLHLTMNGCCILKGSPISHQSLPADAFTPWKNRIIPNFYPGARCDGVVMTAEEEKDTSGFFDKRAAQQLAAEKLKDEADRINELWPPTSYEFCLNSQVTGDLSKRGVSLGECYKLSKSEGQKAASERARTGGYFVRDFGLWKVDSAGGVEPFGKFVNPRAETDIKYIELQIAMHNAVGDQLRSEIGNRAIGSIRVTGPIANEDGEQSNEWGPVWYNHSATCLKILSVRVEFMNRKSINFAGPTLAKALHPKLLNVCGVRRKG